MFSKLRLSRLGIISSVIVLCALLAGSFAHPDFLPIVFLFATAVLTFLAFAIYNSLRLNLTKTIGASRNPKQWKMLFFATISTGFSLILFLTTFIAPDSSELLGVGLLFSLTASVYLFLASQSVALKSIGMENLYWIGGAALHSCVFFMLYTMEREFYNVVIFLFIASIIALLASFIYPHLKRVITKKDNLSYFFSSAGFTLLVSYSAVATFLRNYKTISAGYQFMDFAFITIFYAMIIVGMDLEANN